MNEVRDSRHDAASIGVPRATPIREWTRSKLHLSNGLLVLVVLSAIALWEITARLDIVDAFFVSYPSVVFVEMLQLPGDARVRGALATTGRTMLLAFLLGTTIGVVVGYLMGFFRLIRDAFYGAATFLLSVPKSAFIPIFLALFGINQRTAIYYGAFSSFIYVLMNVLGGFDQIEEGHRRVAYAYSANLRYRLTDVIIPGSLPGVFTGIWYGIKNSLQGVLILELFVSVGGIGQLVQFYANSLRTERVFAMIIFVSIVAIAAGSAWSAIEKRLSRWRGASA